MADEVTLQAANRDEALTDPILHGRLQHAPRSPVSDVYTIIMHGKVVGIAVLDVWPDSDSIVLYELFIAPDWRGRGIGTKALAAVEVRARELGRLRVDLLIRSLDQDRTDEQLTRWYTSRGYAPLLDGSGLHSRAVR